MDEQQSDKKLISLDDLAKQMTVGFAKADEKMATGFAKAETNREDLATMIAGGFNDVLSRMATKQDTQELGDRMTKLEQRMEGVSSSVNNYLRLSDARYLELKHQNEVYA